VNLRPGGDHPERALVVIDLPRVAAILDRIRALLGAPGLIHRGTIRFTIVGANLPRRSRPADNPEPLQRGDRGEARLWHRWRRARRMLPGCAVQVVTVRYPGIFLGDPLEVPARVLGYVAWEPGTADPSCVRPCAGRRLTVPGVVSAAVRGSRPVR
jgi:hypothetical protein